MAAHSGWPYLRFGEWAWTEARDPTVRRWIVDLCGQQAREWRLPMSGSVLALLALRVLHRVRAEVDRITDLAVAQARAEGASWAAIGDALGMTRTGAHKRFSPKLGKFERSAWDEVSRARYIAGIIMTVPDETEPDIYDAAEDLLVRYQDNPVPSGQSPRLIPNLSGSI